MILPDSFIKEQTMILSDTSIRKLIKDKKLLIKGLSPNAIQPSSIDLSLGESALLLKYWTTQGILDFNTKMSYEKIFGQEFVIPPHSFILATTKEYVQLPKDISGFVEGRSSVGRMGLFIQNASVVGPGFKGKLTLELYNANILPIRLEAGRRVCQLLLFQMDRESKKGYTGKYQNQKSAESTKIFLEKRNKK